MLNTFLIDRFHAGTGTHQAFVVTFIKEHFGVLPVHVDDELTPSWPTLEQDLQDSATEWGSAVQVVYLFGYSPLARRWAHECQQQARHMKVFAVDVEQVPAGGDASSHGVRSSHPEQTPVSPPAPTQQRPLTEPAAPQLANSTGPESSTQKHAAGTQDPHAADRRQRLARISHERRRFAANPSLDLDPTVTAALGDALTDPYVQLRCLTWADETTALLWTCLVNSSSRGERAIPAAILAFALYRMHRHAACAAALAQALLDSPDDPLVTRVWELIVHDVDPETVVADLTNTLGTQ